MAKPALRERAAKKEKRKKDTPEAPPSQIQKQVTERPIFLEALFVREFQRMSAENKRLREENDVFKAKEENRRQQVKDAQARLRNKDPEAYRKYERERKRRRRAELKRQAQSSDQ